MKFPIQRCGLRRPRLLGQEARQGGAGGQGRVGARGEEALADVAGALPCRTALNRLSNDVALHY